LIGPSLLANLDAPGLGISSFLRFSFKAAPLGGNLGNLSVALLPSREMGETSLPSVTVNNNSSEAA